MLMVSLSSLLFYSVSVAGIYESYRYQRGFPSNATATGNKVFVFDPKSLRWGAYNRNGRLISTGKASGGRNCCSRTPRGVFSVYHKGNSACRSSKYPRPRGGAPMPYCMFFHKGYAIHGSPDVPNHNASKGCIRLVPSDARWLHRNFIDYGTKVVVRGY